MKSRDKRAEINDELWAENFALTDEHQEATNNLSKQCK